MGTEAGTALACSQPVEESSPQKQQLLNPTSQTTSRASERPSARRRAVSGVRSRGERRFSSKTFAHLILEISFHLLALKYSPWMVQNYGIAGRCWKFHFNRFWCVCETWFSMRLQGLGMQRENQCHRWAMLSWQISKAYC